MRTRTMPYGAAHSIEADAAAAVSSICDGVREQVGGASPDLSFLFVSHDHAEAFDGLAADVCRQTGTRVLLGCTGETIVGGRWEMEAGPAISLWSAVLREVALEPFRLEFSRTNEGIGMSGLPAAPADGAQPPQAIFLLGEPFTSAPDLSLQRLSEAFPGVPVIGGMSSGGAGPGLNRLYFNSQAIDSGAVGVVVRGNVRVRSIVSQGCRPIGTHYVVTRAEQNVVYELGGVSPLEKFSELFPTLSEQDQMLAQRGLHLGIVMNEYQETFERGDFLISNVIGADQETGAIAIGNRVRTGRTVQFHVRDAQTADEDFLHLLEQDRDANTTPPQAALLFSCNGRGTRLFPEPNHDAASIQQIHGRLPQAGFFAQGELGPVGGKNYIHGFTASVALFE